MRALFIVLVVAVGCEQAESPVLAPSENVIGVEDVTGGGYAKPPQLDASTAGATDVIDGPDAECVTAEPCPTAVSSLLVTICHDDQLVSCSLDSHFRCYATQSVVECPKGTSCHPTHGCIGK